jgi:hypothetical protein
MTAGQDNGARLPVNGVDLPDPALTVVLAFERCLRRQDWTGIGQFIRNAKLQAGLTALTAPLRYSEVPGPARLVITFEDCLVRRDTLGAEQLARNPKLAGALALLTAPVRHGDLLRAWHEDAARFRDGYAQTLADQQAPAIFEIIDLLARALADADEHDGWQVPAGWLLPSGPLCFNCKQPVGEARQCRFCGHWDARWEPPWCF